MNKLAKPVEFAEPKEVRFLALPRPEQVGDRAVTEQQRRRVEFYRHALEQAYQAQARAAVIAAEILRPQDLAEARHVKNAKIREARRQYEQEALAVFSETCTKGL